MAKTDRSRFVPLSHAIPLALREVPKSAKSEYVFLNDETKKPLGRRGVDLYVVQKLLGHTTPKMTQRYAHLGSNQLKEAIEKIDIQVENLLYNSKFDDEKEMDSRLCGNDIGIV